MKKYKLVLSGSGTKFPAFLGAIKRLLKENIAFEAYAGTSGGSLIAASLASGLTVEEVEALCLSILPNKSRLLDFSFLNLFVNWGLIKGSKIENEIRQAIQGKDFKDLQVPLHIIAVNYDKVSLDRPYDIFNKENTPALDIARAVRASMSIPVAFEPVDIYGDRYIDGGMTSNFSIDLFGVNDPNVIGLNMSGVQGLPRNRKRGIFGLVQYLLDMIQIFIIGSVSEHKEDAVSAKIINLHTNFGTIDFNINEKDVLKMIQDGYDSVDKWLTTHTLN